MELIGRDCVFKMIRMEELINLLSNLEKDITIPDSLEYILIEKYSRISMLASRLLMDKRCYPCWYEINKLESHGYKVYPIKIRKDFYWEIGGIKTKKGIIKYY